jgi:aryl-alcohol dehydrogenase-like predicted oxidoreductase
VFCPRPSKAIKLPFLNQPQNDAMITTLSLTRWIEIRFNLRELRMEYRRCGNTDLELSIIGVGCWPFGGGDYWGHQDQKEVDALVRRALELGINHFDTAEAYNDGRSEESLGQAIRGLPRERVVIGTKVSPSNTYPKTLREHCEQALRRLGTDYIDLYMVHWPIHLPAIEFCTQDETILANPPRATEAFETLLKLKAQGKIRHIGVSNFGIGPLEEALASASQIAVNQLAYSLIARAIEWEILPYCRQKGIGVVGYMPLWQGLLSDKFSDLDELPPERRRTRHFDPRNNPQARHGEEGAEDETRRALQAIREIAAELGTPLAQLALRWTFADPGITSAIVGARSVHQIEFNAGAASLTIPPDTIARLNDACRPLMEKLGPSFDYFEGTANDRTSYGSETAS